MLINYGFNKIILNKFESVNFNYFSCDVDCQKFLDLNLIAIDNNNNIISDKTKEDYYTFYNEVSTKKNISINLNNDNSNSISIFLVCYSNEPAEIEVSNYMYETKADKNIKKYFDLENFKKLNFKKEYDWKNIINYELNKNKNKSVNDKFSYPLIKSTYNNEEIISMIDVLLTDRLTMGKNVDLFEKKFAEYIGSKYAIMVNSGSSANLLAMAVASNYLRKNKLNKGDKVIVPNICWSTSVWPIIQMGLVPVFVDVDPYTLNMDINDLKRIISENNDIKGIVAVHILGNCTDMDELMKIVKENNLFLMEDTCESLGSTFKGKKLGNFGDFGTYSFYYSHHITTIEGGMVVCNNDEDYELLKCLRAHGWTRYLNNKTEIEQEYKDVDNRFLFVNVGYNFRPMETQGAMGIVQLKKLDEKNLNRNYNFHSLMNAFTNHKKFNDQFEFIHAQNNSDPAWFSFPVILNEKYESNYNDFLSYLSKNNIENRPVVTGNFVRQPIFKLMNLEQKYNADDFKGGEIIHKRGFFIGLPCEKLSDEDILTVANIFMNYDF